MSQPTSRWANDATNPPFLAFTVNRSLTPRRRRATENDEYAAFLHRAIRAYSRRVANGDIDAVSDMAAIAAACDTAITEAISGLRAMGYSWADIAARLGITRQAAQQRWGTSKPPQDLHPGLGDALWPPVFPTWTTCVARASS
jgi:hypothetical protein